MANKMCAAAAIPLLLALPAAARAQRTELALDFRPVAGVLSVACPATSTWSAGIGIGGGIDELDRTLSPNTNNSTFQPFVQILHVSTFLRRAVSRSIDVDIGLRAGLGDIRQCTASDCWPAPYTGLYANAFWGGERWKVGPRLMWAVVRESGHTDGVLYLELITGRVSFRW